ncbi:MAG: extracellular solute-binding protein [Chloroflexi bacterium]|nr:extracellular solute-binding protein [Chloroflexota bacterium]
MDRKHHLLLIVGAFISFSVACTQTPSLPPAPAAVVQKGSQPSGWEENWNHLIAEAKREGNVNVYATTPVDTARRLSQMFKDQYGINVDWTIASGSPLLQKLKAERTAGLYLADVGTFSLQYTAQGLIEMTDPIEPLLIRPDVKDPGKWFGGKLPFADKQGHMFAIILQRTSYHIYNTDQVKDGEIKSIRDFLNPKWKGKIALFNPFNMGSTVNWYQFTLKEVLGMEQGRAYMKELANSVVITSPDYRLLTEGVARGKYSIAICVRPEEPLQFMREGAPIKFVEATERQRTGFSWGLIDVLKNRPHPRAAQLFINWLFTQPVLDEIRRVGGQPISRVDVSTEGIQPFLIPQPGDMLDNEDNYLTVNEMAAMAVQDFAILRK